MLKILLLIASAHLCAEVRHVEMAAVMPVETLTIKYEVPELGKGVLVETVDVNMVTPQNGEITVGNVSEVINMVDLIGEPHRFT